MSLKRAKWVEGITTSKRILRDLAEIVTTAIKDETGNSIQEENWQLVYPRPFEESDVVRGSLVKDAADTTELRYVPTGLMEESIKLVGTTPVVLKNSKLIESSLIVKSANGAVTYTLNTDYTYNAADHSITRVEGGAIMSGAELTITYNFTFNKILDTVPVKVEKKLTTPVADRDIDPTYYGIDYEHGILTFYGQPPTADSYLFTFSEITGTYTRANHDKLALIPDPLDVNGRKFLLPSGMGEIAKELDYHVIGSASAGAGAIAVAATPYGAAYTLDDTNRQVTFATAPTLSGTSSLYLTFSEYDATFTTSTELVRVMLEADPADPTGQTYNILGGGGSINVLARHFVELYTENTKPALFQHLNTEDSQYELVLSVDYIVDYNNPSIHFVTPQTDEFMITFKSRGALDIGLGLSKIKDRVVLKTITKPDAIPTSSVDSSYGASDAATELEMFVEINKPERLVNPETGLERYTDVRGAQIGTQYNNHYLMVRMFDKWDDAIQAPLRTTYGAGGVVTQEGANISNWSKYAWFRDWKEYLVDELDSDAGVSNVNDGVIFQEIKTTGIDENFPVQFWISTNNNRVAMILMGDPTLDQENFLTSFAYLGRIQPFYDTKYTVRIDPDTGECVKDGAGQPIIDETREYFENDVSGNFAMTLGSSTLPADIGIPPKGQAIISGIDLNVDPATSSLIPGELYDQSVYSYLVTYLANGGESKPTLIGAAKLPVGKVVDPLATSPQQGIGISLRFTLPDEATGYKIYRYHEYNKSTFDTLQHPKYENFKLVAKVNRLESGHTINFVDDGTTLSMKVDDPLTGTTTIVSNSWHTAYKFVQGAVPVPRSFESVIRDKYTGAILDVKFSQAFGKDTATGVNDVVMFRTRSGLKFQRHYPAFITTEEFLKKEKSGQSRWTGKFHLSPIYIEHSYDKQRGWLEGVMAVDDSGIAHLDELIVDKDTPREEVYKFFRVNAPFSMFNNSPNHAYGLAVIKTSMKWGN